ncbi:MAG: calcium-binding protein [Phycisphaerales bacterium]|nr:calcium-binding protein [Phycisphaerales bacterium]
MNAMFESLETRKLLASVTAAVVNGQLQVTGTAGRDVVQIGYAETIEDGIAIYDSSGQEPKLIAQFAKSKFTSAVIDLKAGNDELNFDSGDYFFKYPGYIPVTVHGGDGNDDLFDGYGTPTIKFYGDAGNDTITNIDGFADGGTGDDLIRGFLGHESDIGGNESLIGGDGKDTIYGNGGADTILGGNGDDQIIVGPGYDYAPGHVMHSTVDAGAGNDSVFISDSATVHLGDGYDKAEIALSTLDNKKYDSIVVYGDAGNDIIRTVENDVPVVPAKLVKIYGGTDNDTIYGGQGQDVLNGEGGNDKIFGGHANDTINGGTGNDILYGDDGNDDIYGSDGNDTLYGGTGNNRLFGQKGIDTIHSKNGSVDQIIGSQDGDILDKDSFDVLS